MKKRLAELILTMIFAVILPVACYAEGWVQDENGWRYQEYDGNWRTDGWVGDDHDDSISYYLDENGYMMTNAMTLDGCWVDENGTWVNDMVRADNEKRRDDEPPAKQFTLESKDVSQYPLIGKIPYSIWIDGTAQLFTNNAEYAQSNLMKSNRDIRMRDANVLLYLAGLYDGELTEYEWAVAEKVREFLSSFDWQGASDYEKAERAIRFIVERCTYEEINDEPLLCNSSYSCLVKDKSMCNGFAASFHLLTKAIGVKSYYVSNVSHSWNYVKIADTYYKIDVSSIAQDKKAYEFIENTYQIQQENLSLDYNIRYSLSTTADDADKYIWDLNGSQVQFDPRLPTKPLF